MNIFKKNKSQSIAILVNLAINGLIIILLLTIPLQDSQLDNVEQDFSILLQNEILDEIPLPPPTLQKKSHKRKKSTKESANEKLIKEIDQNIENFKKISPSSQSVDVHESKDSVILSELKQLIKVIQDVTPTDTLPDDTIVKEVRTVRNEVIAENNRYNDRQFYVSNYRTIMSLKKVFPYVIQAKKVVDDLNFKLSTMTDNREKQRLIKKTEKELFAQFEKDVRTMSTSQGKLLLKLIARETNQTGYEIVKTYKGTLPATFWYGVGLLFKEDLKMKYDSVGEDAVLEKVVVKYKLGKF